METLDKRLFFLKCMELGLYKRLSWSIRAFSLTRGEAGEYEPYVEGKEWVVKMGESKLRFEADITKPLFSKREVADFKKGDFIGCEADCNAPYAWVLWHHLAVVYAFNGKIPFDPNPRRLSDIEKIIAQRLTNNPEDRSQNDPAKIYVWELLKYTEATACILSGLTQLFTPGTTRKSLVTDPKVRELREKLLEQYKDRLHDPATIAIIKGELSKVDKDWVKGDDSQDYLIGKKNFDIVRMKTLLMHGEESAFGDGTQVNLIPTSLDEGLNLKNLPDYANSLREGSFNRGAQTALGGEAVQYLIRVFQNHAITEDDCGSVLGIKRFVSADKAKRYIGFYIIVNGKTVHITEQNLDAIVNKTITLRSPQRCLTPGAGYCGKCMGDMNARFPNSPGGQASDMGSMMLYIFMGKAHGTALKTTRFDPRRHFT